MKIERFEDLEIWHLILTTLHKQLSKNCLNGPIKFSEKQTPWSNT